MTPWEIWTYDFADEQTHPVVIFSNPVRVANPDLERVNVLFCTTMRGHKHWTPKPHEVILDAADGLAWATRCRCDALTMSSKPSFVSAGGSSLPNGGVPSATHS